MATVAPKESIPNRPGEPDFKMEMSPDRVTFSCATDKKPVYCDVAVKNTTSERQSFKVKCTSGEIFRVQPPIGFVKPGETVNIRIWYQNKSMPQGEAKHYFAFYHVAITGADEKKKEKEIWTKTTKPEGVRRLMAVFQEKK